MQAFFWFKYFLLILGFTEIYGQPTVFVKRLENCDPNIDYALKYNVTFNVIDNKQYANGDLRLKEPFDNNISINVTIDTLVEGKYTYLFQIKEKNSCIALYKYLGEFSYELQRYVGILVGACPVVKGRYHAHNLALNFDKITTINNFPSGNLRFTGNLYDEHNKLYSCVVLELENYHSVQ